MIRYSVLGSGSSGNSYVIGYDGSAILIDAGFSLRETKARTARAGISFDTIQALFITHLHPDHAKGAGVFARNTGRPVFVHRALIGSAELEALGIPSGQLECFDENVPVELGPFRLKAFATSHDSPHPVGYTIAVAGYGFMVLTDTGTYDATMVEKAKDADVLFLEANYEPRMLERGPYPLYLKRRIAGEHGHLSNHAALELLRTCSDGSGRFRMVYFCHLSLINNDPELLARQLGGLESVDAGLVVCHHGIQYVDEIG
jgi:phosphoribosyl 1,2-cyclic phosphodiesterase